MAIKMEWCFVSVSALCHMHKHEQDRILSTEEIQIRDRSGWKEMTKRRRNEVQKKNKLDADEKSPAGRGRKAANRARGRAGRTADLWPAGQDWRHSGPHPW